MASTLIRKYLLGHCVINILPLVIKLQLNSLIKKIITNPKLFLQSCNGAMERDSSLAPGEINKMEKSSYCHYSLREVLRGDTFAMFTYAFPIQ